MTTIKRQPIIYNGEGSASDNYFKKKPEGITNAENWGLFNKDNPRHMKILSQLRTAQWVIPNERYGEVVDLIRFSEWLKSDKSPVKKPLLKMNSQETEKIIIATNGIINHTYK